MSRNRASAAGPPRSPAASNPRRSRAKRQAGLRVALSGASGTIGPALMARLVRSDEVGEIAVIGRHRPRDLPPQARFQRVDVRAADQVSEALKGSDVVVHLAFDLYGVLASDTALFATNVTGTVNVARGAVAAGARRFVYTSSAAVYGFRADNPQPLTEADHVRASSRHFYARHKAQAELLLGELFAGAPTQAYVFRPGAIVGPHAAGALAARLPAPLAASSLAAARELARVGLRPALPVPPRPVQFLHEDDVAQALALAALGGGPPGIYNLAGEGAVPGTEILRLLGFRTLPLPRLLVEGTARVLSATPPPVPATRWFEPFTEPQLLDTSRARDQLGWRPQWDSRAALRATRRAIGW